MINETADWMITMLIDISLVERARDGDVEAFSELYEVIGDDLYRYALYTLGNGSDAEDAVSETFAEAFRGIRKLRDPSAFKAWMFRILSIRCKRKIADYIRMRSVLDIDDFEFLSDGGSMEESSGERTVLLDALSELKADERMLVILSAVHGYTAREISKIVGSPQGTISSKLCRTYSKLRQRIER